MANGGQLTFPNPDYNRRMRKLVFSAVYYKSHGTLSSRKGIVLADNDNLKKNLAEKGRKI